MKGTKPTSFDIAYLAGVSQPTVSRALRNSPLVSEETRLKVQRVAEQLNYKVDVSARNLRSGQTKTIALLVCKDPGVGQSLINPFFLSMLGNITQASARSGYDLLVSFQQSSDDWGRDYEYGHRADGIIFLGYGDYLAYTKKIAQLDDMDAHFIAWGPVIEGQPGCFIGCDNFSGGYHATQHLLSKGRRHIAFLGDVSEHYPEFHQRYMGHAKALLEANIVPNPALQRNADTSEEMGYLATLSLLDADQPIDAIFGASDLIAIGAIQALQQRKLNVPQDVAVIGFDDIPIASFTSPPLTTVRQDTLQAGELLVENLLKIIAGEEVKSLLMPAPLIVRASCGASPKAQSK